MSLYHSNTSSGTVGRSARSPNFENFLERYMMEVISSDAIFAGNRTEVPKARLVPFTLRCSGHRIDFVHKFSATFFSVHTK